MKYRKRPITVDAVQVDVIVQAAKQDRKALPTWIRKAYEEGFIVFVGLCVSISTSEGVMTGVPGDWIIKGVRGELYPCKPDIFEATYDKAEE